jgi:putative ATP-dependent endonuclease of OLD family
LGAIVCAGGGGKRGAEGDCGGCIRKIFEELHSQGMKGIIMRIRKIHVQNFRNLRNVCVYPSKTTVIVGENDSGKSNFLYSLRLLLDPFADRLRFDLSELDICDLAKRNGDFWFSILIEIGDLQKHIEVETCFKERISQDGDETFVMLEGKYEKGDDGEYGFNVRVLSPAGRHNDPIPMKPRMYRAIPLYYLDALRDASRDLRASGRSVLGQLIDDMDFSDVEGEVQSHLHNANLALDKGKGVNALAGGISSQLTQLIPGGQGNVKLTVNDEDTLSIKRSIRLSIQKSPTSGLSDILRHGTGLQNLTVVALFRHKVANSNMGVPILAIEEPEAHLHPHAQRRLFSDLALTDAPVVITTHSTAIIKNADPTSIILFRTIGDSTTSFQLNKTSLEDSDRTNLAQLVRGGRSELFFARAIILVEGESELISLPAFAHELGCDLDREGISLIDAGSNNFAYILKSCGTNQFSIPIVITYDTDVLENDNGLLKEAYKAGLIDKATRDSWDKIPGKTHKMVRKEVLDKLGWFGAEECYEEEVCKNGYINTVLKAIDDADPENHSDTRALQAFIEGKNLTINPQSITAFIKKRNTLKIPVAREVASTAKTIKKIPFCYANAIRKAILLSRGGILVDDFFEQRAYSAGFRDVIFEFLQGQGVINVFQEFINTQQISIPALGLSRFFTETEVGLAIRSNLKETLVNAVEICGCKDYADHIRTSDFPPIQGQV